MRAEPSYTVKEAAALAGLSESIIRNEIERGVIPVKRGARGRSRMVALPRGAVFYFRLLRDIPVRLPRGDRGDLYRLLAGKDNRSGAWLYERGTLRRGILVLDAKAARSDLEHNFKIYAAGLRKTESDPDLLGGEPVFAGTRIAIRHLGKLVLKGVPAGEIKADYPALGDDDIAFAAMFARMKPAPGRPARLRFRRELA